MTSTGIFPIGRFGSLSSAAAASDESGIAATVAGAPAMSSPSDERRDYLRPNM
jgi:hypothetical protein